MYYYFLYTLLTISIVYSLYQFSNLLKNKNSNELLICDKNKLELINILQPWIQANIEKAAEFIIQKYIIEVNRNRMKKEITPEIYQKMIYDIQSHFYGSIPMSVNSEFLFKYIDRKQIDILIISAFRIYNDDFFKIIPE